MSCRADKYVWAVRIAKTRSQASELISKGKIKLNEMQIKPSRDVKIGDVISVYRNSAVFSYKIVELLDKRVGAKLVTDYLLDITPPEEVEKFKTYQLAQSAYREYGTGRPTKRDRRDIEDYLDWLGPQELQNLTVRELTADLQENGLEVTERYVKQILDQARARAERMVQRTEVVQAAWARGQALSLHGWVYRIASGVLQELIAINPPGRPAGTSAAPAAG